jgi:hypothetical protein
MKMEPKHDNEQLTLETVAAALDEYVEEVASATGQGRSMPALKELHKLGRAEYVIQYFGGSPEQLGLPPNLSPRDKV